MYIGLHVKYPLFLSYFNESWILSTDFRKILICQIQWKPVQWEPSCSVRTERRTDSLDEANGRFIEIVRMCLKTLHENTIVQSVARGPCVVRCPILRHARGALWWNRALGMWRLDGPGNKTHVFTGTRLSPKKLNTFQKYWWTSTIESWRYNHCIWRGRHVTSKFKTPSHGGIDVTSVLYVWQSRITATHIF